MSCQCVFISHILIDKQQTFIHSNASLTDISGMLQKLRMPVQCINPSHTALLHRDLKRGAMLTAVLIYMAGRLSAGCFCTDLLTWPYLHHPSGRALAQSWLGCDWADMMRFDVNYLLLKWVEVETRDRSNSIKGHIVLLNTLTAVMPIYAHPQTLGFVLGHADHCTTMPPGKRRQTTHRLQQFSIGRKSPQNCPFPWGIQNPI